MENQQEPIQEPKKQTNAEKIQNSVYSVQSAEMESTDSFAIEYKGTPILTTKERYTELALKAINYDKALNAYNKMKQSKEKYENAYREVIEKYKELVVKNGALEKELVKLREKLAVTESALTSEKAISQQLGQKLAKFTDNHSNMPSKKTVFSDQEKQVLLKMWVEGKRMDAKYNIRKLHEQVARLGRQSGNKRIAEVSYETVRATVAELKQLYPNAFLEG